MDVAHGFEGWKKALRDDCLSEDKLASFDALGEYVLTMLWLRGLEPTVSAVAGQDTAPTEIQR